MFGLDFKSRLVVGLALGLVACSSTGAKDEDTANALTQVEAFERSAVVSDVDYDLKFELSGTEDIFKGNVEVHFTLSAIPRQLFLDFQGGKVHALEVNGTTAKVEYNTRRLSLPLRELKIGKNAVLVTFERPHSHDGSGFHRFTDPQDKNVYLYTDLEPFNANQVFPTFDQPDLKARYRIRVTAPKSWEVVTYAYPDSVDTRELDRVWNFPWSQRFSTYIFSLIAGPYKIWKSKAGNIPLRLLARQTLADRVDADEWLKVTAQGMAFFPKYFGYEYPFGKYDQIIVPEFNAGAMENVAAVTFTERSIFRSKPTVEQRQGRSDTILHEMAHMWFGNLVTMRWWDGLWLNESFATYLSSIALTNATEFKDSWRSFYADTKNWAYWTDELVTTHAIQTPVEDTNVAFANFDGITYGKGAASLKQLHFLIGDEAFQKGLKIYFQRFAFKSTELKDFIDSLEESSGRSLDTWVQDWLMTAGLNSVKVKWQCESGSLKAFDLLQTAPKDHPTLREHRTRVAFFKNSGKSLDVSSTETVTYSGPSTRHVLAKPVPCPAAIYPNHEDHDYVKVVLDDTTLQVAQEKLALIKDPLLRNMMLQSMWNRVRDGEWNLLSYLKVVYSYLPSEKDDITSSATIETLGSAGTYLTHALRSKPTQEITAQENALENFLGIRLRDARAGSDIQAQFFTAYVNRARGDAAQAVLRDWLKGDKVPKGLSLGQDRRWRIVKRLNRLGVKDADALIATELKREDNDYAQKAALASKALRPDAALKKDFWNRLVKAKDSLDDQKQIAWNLFPSDQADLQEPWADEFFSILPKLAKERDEGFLDVLVNLTPATCTPKSNERLSRFIKKQGAKLPHALLKELRINLQEDERCVRVLENLGSSGK